ncbi:MAG: energy transducer TonB family protein, partial [Bryobacteraceae bacterium]
ALIGSGSRSLVNLINDQSLMKRGQRDAVVMVSCGVDTLGFAGGGEFYRGSPDSEKLGREVVERIDHAQFVPAVYHHVNVATWISGTVAYFIKEGKPHLQVYLNQEQGDLAAGHDFIAPQFAYVETNYKWHGFYWPRDMPGHDGLVAVKLDVDTDGKVRSSKLAYEYPPGKGFGPEVVGRIVDAAFIPGFRNGKMVRSQFTQMFTFNFLGHQMKSG